MGETVRREGEPGGREGDGARRRRFVRSAAKISIFSMRPTCVANIADIKRRASGGWRGFASEGEVRGARA